MAIIEKIALKYLFFRQFNGIKKAWPNRIINTEVEIISYNILRKNIKKYFKNLDYI